ENCAFEGSELVHLNFGGAAIFDSTFNDSNLYNSRFINADMTCCDFIDCNIKKAYFIKARQEGVSFKSSNTAEAGCELEL
ncbi:MAG: pentapeptide repeat-containing protein, partial [Spirochaetaceae bacterium]|nr:pentapeptide repeat-containing protein [Spirochaetaceae bacterium]